MSTGSQKISEYASGQISLIELNLWATKYLADPEPRESDSEGIARFLLMIANDYGERMLKPMSDLTHKLAMEFAAGLITTRQA